MADIVQAPWTNEQVLRAESWQRSRNFHPYTCGNREDHPYEDGYGDHGVLRATVRGWVCAFCDYTQDWAHNFTLNEDPPTKSVFDLMREATEDG